jgi:hypothetical protein
MTHLSKRIPHLINNGNVEQWQERNVDLVQEMQAMLPLLSKGMPHLSNGKLEQWLERNVQFEQWKLEQWKSIGVYDQRGE